MRSNCFLSSLTPRLYLPEPTYNFEAAGIALVRLWLMPFLASDKSGLGNRSCRSRGSLLSWTPCSIKRFSGFDSNLRLLLIAPHPDDEALGCGVTLRRAVCAGAAIRRSPCNRWREQSVATKAEIERSWRYHSSDHKRWGAVRRNEALSALQVLGVDAFDVCFLGLPDQGLDEFTHV